MARDATSFVVEQVIPALDRLNANATGEFSKVHQVVDELGVPLNFRLVEDLAGGASARIYKSYSRDAHALRPIAIKRILAAPFKDHEEEFMQLLDRERNALRELKPLKQFVTEFYGYYYHSTLDEHWLAMEFCDGASLFEISPFLSNARVTQPLSSTITFNKGFKQPQDLQTVNLHVVAAIAAGMLRGLDAIHKAGFIHGDIKSGNVMLCYPGVVKICDFGLTSKVVGVKHPDYHALGTLDYMAPEQLRKSLALDNDLPHAELFKYDHKIDVWACGIVIMELLLGRTPLYELRCLDESTFSYFIANLSQRTQSKRLGSALGHLFYLPYEQQSMLSAAMATHDRDFLCDRIPVLRANKKFLLEMLMRPNLHNRRPNPRAPLPRPKVGKLFMLNKCLDFVGQCLFIRYRLRPDAAALQEHPFVKPACKELKTLDGKIESLTRLQRRRGQRKAIWRKFRCSLTVHEIFKVLEEHKNYKKLILERERI